MSERTIRYVVAGLLLLALLVFGGWGARYLFAFVLSLAIVAGAAWLDIRTRRGFGLGILSLLLIALSAYLGWAFTLTLQREAHTDDLATGFVLIAYWAIIALWGLMVLIGAVVAAVRARQWGWIVVFVGAVLVSVGGGLVKGASPVTVALGEARLWGTVVVPLLAVLAYSLYRTVRPIAPAQEREPVSLR